MVLYSLPNAHLVFAGFRLVGGLQKLLVAEGLMLNDALVVEFRVELLFVYAGRHLCWVFGVMCKREGIDKQ